MKTKTRNFIVSIFLLAVFSFAASLFAETLPLKIYTTTEGLSHDSVNRIVRDSHGFLWFCTVEGLSRFDGYKFKNYTMAQGLPHRGINDFLETKEGDYLVSTNYGIAVFNPNGKAFRWNMAESKLVKDSDETPLFQPFFPESDNRQKKVFQDLFQDANGKIWAGTDKGIVRIEKYGENDWRFREISVESEPKDETSFFSFTQIKPDEFFVSSSLALYKIGADEKPIKILDHSAAAILKDRNENIWLDSGTKPTGLEVYKYQNGKLEKIKTYTKKDGLPADDFYFALFQTSDGRIFVGEHDGLSEFLPNAKDGEPKFRILGKEKVTALEEDSGGNLWVGTELHGTWKLAASGFALFGEKDGILPSDDIRAIQFMDNGQMILPLKPQNALVFSDGKFVNFKPFGITKRSWGWHYIDVLSNTGEWWLPTNDGLFRYPKVENYQNLANTPPKKIYTTTDGLPGNEIFNVFKDSRGDIWFTVIGAKNALIRWDSANDTINPTTDTDNLPLNNGPLSFAEDKFGNLWMGYYFGGLSRYHDGKFQVFTAKDGLPESQIIDLLHDSSGRIWIATSGAGLYRIDSPNDEKPVFNFVSVNQKLSSNQLICMTEDKFGRIYIGTGRGINRIDKNENVRIFTTDDGLPSNYITRCATDRTGDLWFVSRNQLVRFSPKADAATKPPTVFIDKILINGVPQRISDLGETNIEMPELNSDQRQIQIDFFAMTFTEGENIRYQYKLDAQDWSNPTEQQTINLDLAAGKHEFLVRAVRSDNKASENPAKISLKILPPIWARWWFILLSALFVAVVILSLYYYRTSNLRAINAALTEAKLAEEDLRKSKEERIAELEKVRSRIATDLHDDIGASLTQIAILSEVAKAQNSKGNGASAEPLSKISDVSNELVGKMSDIVWSINPSKDHLSDLTQRMRRFASDVLSATGIAFQFFTPEAEREITLSTNIRREVFLIYKESVNNILKHSQAALVEIEINISDKNLHLRISDNGKGFSPDKLLENSLSSMVDYGGNGILSMKKRAAEMNGKLEIISANGKGTTVNLTLPIEQNIAV
ncbi:MAG TPA: two-component regulator propeller domain-containing protein [Pyrinomonadaceae bacterium]|nr:two-component regulator propeller domain-containing protein [Pyrinomonadaceae bacterium]